MHEVIADSGQHGDLACEQCRRRKSRCDRTRPRCGYCVRTGTACVFVEKRPKRGPKKGQLQALRAKVVSLEQQLAEQASTENTRLSREIEHDGLEFDGSLRDADLRGSPVAGASEYTDWGTGSWLDDIAGNWVEADLELQDVEPDKEPPTPMSHGCLDLPDLLKADLDALYFDRVHPFAPFLDRERYLSWADQETPGTARACLRLAMWALASAVSAQFPTHADRLCAAARSELARLHDGTDPELPWAVRHVELDEVQAWLLLAYCDFLRCRRRRNLATAARALRLVQVAGLHIVDAGPLECPCWACSSAGWTVVVSAASEERRRTFWVAFCFDRLLALYSSLPVIIPEEVVRVRFPATNTGPETEARQQGNIPSHSVDTPHKAVSGMSPFAESTTLAELYGRCLMHRRLAVAAVAEGKVVADKAAEEFLRRHEWLAQDLEARVGGGISISSGRLPDRQEDPLTTFNYAMACSAAIHLYDTAVACPWHGARHQELLAVAKNTALRAADGIVLLAGSLRRINYLKMHPFLPSFLAHAAVFLRQHGDAQNGEARIVATLKRFEMNESAKELVEKLDAGVQHIF
ncbi:uncharacterized protein PpBr36_10101 [Pyricularia pennisetigena]|uniref:uncharacterized protein n=1 Tax=Pyricularia pennisetigena TaxID=1578925 RepID=UPI0011524C21|nr:uncharacterized protein PpBr36_10101 [Pyricularia pennisetigena]TLS22354.1 hypothetical protein PpBr36_10101 [Pyricularia pennisetigena]